MKRWLKRIGIALLLLAVLLAGAAVVGAFTPRHHTASSTIAVALSSEAVWALISDFEGSASWRPDVDSVRRLADRGGLAAYEEQGEFGPIRYVVEEEVAPTRLVTRIVDNSDFGGTWTYLIEPTAQGCQLTITEQGEIHNPMFRFLARYVFGYDGTIKGYLESIAHTGRD